MANTHGENSFAAKALPEPEALPERFKDQNESESPEPEPEHVKHDDADDGNERVKELAHIIWHLANHMEGIAFHEGGLCSEAIGDIQNIKRQVTYINDSLDGFDDEPRF